MSYLFTIGIALSFFFFVLLISRKKKKLEHNVLAAFFLIASLNVSYLFFHFITDGGMYLPVITELHLGLPLLYGTIIYFYVRSNTDKNFILKKSHLFHFSPFILFLGFIIWRIHGQVEMEEMLKQSIVLLKPITNTVYLVAALLYLYRLRNTNSRLSKTRDNWKWLLLLCIGGLGFCAISLIGIILNYIYPSIAPMKGDYVLGSVTSIYFFILGLAAFKNTNAFHIGSSTNTSAGQKSLRKNRLGTPLEVNEKHEFKMLQSFMKTEKPYLNPLLSLHDLAKMTEISVSRLSRLINLYGNHNFNDFVNSYRVLEVKAKIVNGENEHLSILGIGLESGFNSKASFNRIFKKQTGYTPSAFREQIDPGSKSSANIS